MHPTNQTHMHSFDNSSTSVCSHGTVRSILSTATPFCVFHDDDNNTVVSYKVVHQTIYKNERHNTNQRHSGLHKIPESSNEICYPDNVEDIANRYEHVPSATTNLDGVVADLWSSNWHEMNDDDSITSAGTIMNRSVRQPQQEIVLVRSKYSYAQENASRLNGGTTSSYHRTISSPKSVWDCDDDSYFGFPWDAYKEAIASGATTKSVKKTKASSRYLPHNFERAAYALVEL
jgi:hypothetical protein